MIEIQHRIKGMKWLLGLILLSVFSTSSYGQSNLVFDRINSSDGLSQNDVNSIYQDKNGFMWFGTHDGLNKFDGYSFTIYRPDVENSNSINSNLIFSMDGDHDGNIWIGTTGMGLNQFDIESQEFSQYRHDKNDANSLSSDHITSVLVDSSNRLWVGSLNGLNVAHIPSNSSDSLKFKQLTPESRDAESDIRPNMVHDLFEDGEHNIYFGTYRGIYRIEVTSKDHKIEYLNNTFGLPENIVVNGINNDQYGRLLIATEMGLFGQQKIGSTSKMIKLLDGSFSVVGRDHNGNIWAGGSSGISVLSSIDRNSIPKLIDQASNDPMNKTSLSKNIVESIFVDRTGIVWIGINGGGVNKYDPKRKKFRHVFNSMDKNSLSYNKIRSIFEDSNGTLWIGTEGGGLNMQLKGAKKQDEFIKFETPTRIYSISEVTYKNRKTLLLGVEGRKGLYQIDITDPKNVNNASLKLIDEDTGSVFSILYDHKENIWLGTYNKGLIKLTFDPNSNSYFKRRFFANVNKKNSLSSDIVRHLYEDSMGNIWIATANGLSLLTSDEVEQEEPRFIVYKNDDGDFSSISDNYVLSLCESSDGHMWVGTFGGGLNKVIWDRGSGRRIFKSFNEKNGLPNGVIKGIVEDDNGDLWMSSNMGLTKFDPETEEFINYDENDGLQSDEFQELAFFKRSNGEILFGGVNGFNSFMPNDIVNNNTKVETVITKLLVFNKPVSVNEKVEGKVLLKKPIDQLEQITLNHDIYSFSFEFTGLHYASPQKNSFSYMLEGFDKGWNYTDANRRFATYTNIEPGTYSFLVRASNNDNIWDVTPSEIVVEIIPPWYRTYWAFAAYVIAVILLLIGVRKLTLIRIHEKNRLKLQDLEKKNQDELQRMKLEFFTNISHEFRTPLTLISGPISYLQSNIDDLDKGTLRRQFGFIQKNTDQLLKLVNQLLDFRKINRGKMKLVVRPGNIESFVQDIMATFQFFAHKNEVKFELKSNLTSKNAWFDHDALEKILNNLISNAFKYTPKQGKIEVILDQKSKKENDLRKNVVVIKVKDSGRGILQADISHVFERFYVEKDKSLVNKSGSGIGLSFTKSLVELHQGKITVESEAGKGTEFTAYLPSDRSAYSNKEFITCKDEEDADFSMRSSEAEYFAIEKNDEIIDSEYEKSKSKTPTILVVDDNADIREYIRSVLQSDFTIYEAENGEVALDMVNKIMPNLVLTDVVMPEMNGIELCTEIKSKKETSHIPVIMLTAKASQESEVESLKIGADAYIRKPFDVEILELRIRNIFKAREELRRKFNREITLQPKEVTVTSLDENFLQQAIDIVEKNMMNTEFNVEMFVREMGQSRSNLYLKLKELTGLSSSEFIRNIRLKRAVQLFEKSDMSVKEIMFQSGFNTASYFAKCFKKQFGVVPHEYIKNRKKASTNVE